MTDNAIDVQGLVKRFGSRAVVNGVSLAIPKGQVWGFLGPNGSGKTTTIRMMCGLLTPSAGSGQCLGFDILRQAKQIKAQTGYMTQKFSFWEDLTIAENLRFVARMYHLSDVKAAVINALQASGLTDRQHQLAAALSGGWKQRLALAAVTMHQPRLLLLDEPTAGVDPQARREFWHHIQNLAQAGVTVLVSTHYMDEAQRCDNIVYLANGKLITQGTVAAVIKQANLVCYRLTGEHIRQYSELLECSGDVVSVAYYGAALFVTGHSKQKLEALLAEAAFNSLTVEPVSPELEDVFIALTQKAGADLRRYQ